MINGGGQHGSQFLLIFRCHDGHIGHVSQKSVIKQTVMSGAVFSDNPPSVQGKHYWMGINADIMEDLIIGPLHKG